jgi:hypothetical protein
MHFGVGKQNSGGSYIVREFPVSSVNQGQSGMTGSMGLSLA